MCYLRTLGNKVENFLLCIYWRNGPITVSRSPLPLTSKSLLAPTLILSVDISAYCRENHQLTPLMTSHLARAIEQIQDSRNSHREVDWTQHTLEDGNVVSTQERVVKDVGRSYVGSLSFR
jgi:hypothetical protein